ncbi:hypothetical protein B0H10DRAFT_1956091 [Mycena sp. CBHHK59/15]|nr:hypothetical protein B0H10DRAFT_1956091 [Mycena sp. CBHHK59/15]
MSHQRDPPDASLMLNGSRSRIISSRINDPSNAERPDPAHQALVAKSIADILELINQIESLCPALPKSVPLGTDGDRIVYVLNKVKGQDTGSAAKSSTFVRRMDLLFGVGAHDENGRMIHMRRGNWGIKLAVQYFRKIDWDADGIPLAIATLKFTQLLEEMRFLCANTNTEPTDASPSSPTDIPNTSSSGSKCVATDALSDSEDGSPSKKIKATRDGKVTMEDVDEDDEDDEFSPSPAARSAHKYLTVKIAKKSTTIASDDDSDTESFRKARKAGTTATRATKQGDRRREKRSPQAKTPSSDPTALGNDGMLADIEVQPLVNVEEGSKMDPTADIKQFFGDAFMTKGRRGPELKSHRKCKTCG